MKYVLILWIWYGNAAAITNVEFNNENDCEAAVQKTLKQWGASSGGFCVSKAP